MTMRHILPVTLLLLLLPIQAMSAEIDDVRLQLIENQRNILQLRKERQETEIELQTIRTQLATNQDPELQKLVNQLEDEIIQSNELLQNLNDSVSQQRLDLLTLERGTPPSSLDIALNKALSSNLPELAKNLANNEAARKEIARLQVLLKEEALVGVRPASSGTSVALAAEQRIAEEEFLRVLSLFSDGEADESTDKTIKITGISKRNAYIENDILSYLGHQQYHMETTVHVGQMTFTVDDRPWQLNVDEEEDGATYIVIYDVSDAEKPRLVMFNKNLLLE